MRRTSIVTLGMAALGAAGGGLVAPGCSKGSSQAGPYEPCEYECAVGRCEWVGYFLSPMNGVACLPACVADVDCPPTKDGLAALCLNNLCRPVACDGNGFLLGQTDPPVVCDQGKLRPCGELASPPCSVCPVCNSTQVCDEWSETCVTKKQDGQPCTDSVECPSGDCRSFVLTDGTQLFDGQRYCRFPTGAPCWSGDPCFCDSGACTFGCDETSDCDNGTLCLYRECRSPPLCTSSSGCVPPATCQNVHTVPAPVLACAASGSRPPRAEGVPCREGAECVSGTCCPPATGETWGHCAGDAGC